MRAFLVFVILILLGLLGATWHFKTRPTEAHRQIIAELKKDLGKALEEQSRLREDLARSRAELARHGVAPAPGDLFPENPAPATPVASDPGRAEQGNPSAPPDPRLAELKAIYDRNLAAIERERSEAEQILAETTAQRKQLANTELKFAEQNVVTDEEGNAIGNRGIRTSQADRDRAHKLRQQKLDEFDAKIKKASETIAGIEQRRVLLDEQYRNALEKAQAEPTGSGR